MRTVASWCLPHKLAAYFTRDHCWCYYRGFPMLYSGSSCQRRETEAWGQMGGTESLGKGREKKEEDRMECVQRWIAGRHLPMRYDHRQPKKHPDISVRHFVFPVMRHLPRGVARKSQGSAFRLSGTKPGLL